VAGDAREEDHETPKRRKPEGETTVDEVNHAHFPSSFAFSFFRVFVIRFSSALA
jgi:hypothetical protein